MTWIGAPAAGVGNEPGKAARRATVFVGVTCGDIEPMPVPVLMPWIRDTEVIVLAPLLA